MITIYGLKSCDTCRKARKALPGAAFVDLRGFAGLEEKLPAWHEAVGARIVNKSSATWRGLGEDEKALADTDPVRLLTEHPTLIKRPVIEGGGVVTAGWTPEVRGRYGA